jgi:putative glutamine amidotransferase
MSMPTTTVTFHDIVWDEGSGLARPVPGQHARRDRFDSSSGHPSLGRGLQVDARSADDDMIEAVRLQGKPYVFGVQWHPEFHPPGSSTLLDCTPILDEFLNAVRNRRW